MLQNNGIKAMAYHGGLPTKERMEVQNTFTSGKVHVVVATIAFGMGIDKSDVRFVIHHDLPKSYRKLLSRNRACRSRRKAISMP